MYTIILLAILGQTQPEILSRTVRQDGGTWIIQYRLKTNPGLKGSDIRIKVESEVSNSSVPGHSIPRESILRDFNQFTNNFQEILCKEKLSYQVKTENNIATLLIKIDHVHDVYGVYEPLLGIRKIDICVKEKLLRDIVDLTRSENKYPRYNPSKIPEECLSNRYFRSPPDSLHLMLDQPGRHYYRFPDQPVRYNTKIKLSFWYLIAYGTESEFKYRINQYKDTATSWRMLNNSQIERNLLIEGKWAKEEFYFITTNETTTVALDFRLTGDSEIGEVWIDDIILEPVVFQFSTNP